MDEEVGSATLKGCATREGDPVSADTEVRLYRIRDIDPVVALGTVGQGGALDEIWVAFEGEPLGYNEFPDQVQQYVEP